MNTPLGYTIGNWLEIRECIDCLQGGGPEDLVFLTHVLSGTMIYLGQKASSVEEGIEISKRKIQDGSAWEKFKQIVEEQEGDVDILLKPEKYPLSQYMIDYVSPKSGWLESINAFDAGMVGIMLGGGRLKQDDVIDPKAGVRFYVKPSDKIRSGQTIFTICTDKKESIDPAMEKLSKAIKISKHPSKPSKLILNYLDKSSL
jgi:pyrimidine-nucleoside phosphorylase